MRLPLISIITFNAIAFTFIFIGWRAYTEPWISIIFNRSESELRVLSLRVRSQAIGVMGVLGLINVDAFGFITIIDNQHLLLLPLAPAASYYFWRRKVEAV